MLSKVGPALAPLVRSRIAVVVFDSNVAPHYRGPVLASLRDLFDRIIECTIPAGEENKTVATVDRLYGQILAHKIDRHTPVGAMDFIGEHHLTGRIFLPQTFGDYLIWRLWPLSGPWVIGLFIGIDLIFYGWSLVMLGLVAKRLSDQRT